jgi:type VI secretion system protein ImpB
MINNRISQIDKLISDQLNEIMHHSDFHPERVADQVEPLRKLVEVRQRLSDLLSKMDGNDRLEELLQDVMASTEKVEQLAKEAGVEKSAAEEEETKKEE